MWGRGAPFGNVFVSALKFARHCEVQDLIAGLNEPYFTPKPAALNSRSTYPPCAESRFLRVFYLGLASLICLLFFRVVLSVPGYNPPGSCSVGLSKSAALHLYGWVRRGELTVGAISALTVPLSTRAVVMAVLAQPELQLDADAAGRPRRRHFQLQLHRLR